MGRTPDRRTSKSRTSRPYLRQRPSRSAQPGNPASLLSHAGLTDRPSVEQLERRQMLFSLAVTADDVNPQTGLGTKTAFVGYYIPYLNTSFVVPPPQTPTVVAEPFSDEPFGPVGSGAFFLASGILNRHSISPPGDYAINSQNQNAQDQNRWLRVNQDQTGEFFSFQFFAPPDNPARVVQARQAVVTITGDGPTDNTGLLTDNVQVDLLVGANSNVVASFTGAALRALIQGNPGLGTGTFTFNAPANAPGFDAVRFTMLSPPGAGVNPAFRVTSVSYTVPQGRFVPLLDARGKFFFEATITGPVGATATFTDLYGRDMNNTLATLANGGLNPGDLNDDGVPEYNDGIGAIRFTGTDSRTAFTMWGGQITAATTAPADSDFFDGQYAAKLVGLAGQYDDFETSGFGYAFDVNNATVRLTGLPPGPGSVIVGSPFVRNNTNSATYRPGGAAINGFEVTTGFTRADQGLFVQDGSSMGSIYVHGILHGSSQFNSFVDRIAVGYLVGSINVQGDLGSLIVGTDAGEWAPDPNFTLTNPNQRLDANNKTASQLVIGRTIGSIDIAGRSLMDVTVIGDLNNPLTRPARNSFNYYEKEFVYGINTTVEPINVIRRTIANTNFVARQSTDLFRASDQAVTFGGAFMRNDTLMTAEWIGGTSSGARISGDLSARDPIQGEDTDDVYAFAADGTQDIVIEATNDTTGTAPYFRIVDQDGRTLAAPQAQGTVRSRFENTQLHFHPNSPGVYYLIIMDPNGSVETGVGATEYTMVVTGMATTSLGSYRVGGGAGFTDINTGLGSALLVLAGSVGSLRMGTGINDAAGAEVASTTTFNTVQTADDAMSWQGGTYTIPGSLYNITTGSDVGNPAGVGGGSTIDVRIGGDLGTFITGQSLVVGNADGRQGDLNFINLTVGGRIAVLDIRGGIGMDQDPTGSNRRAGGGPVNITTGTNGGSGDIGFIRVGWHVVGGELSITTSPHSTIGAFLVSQAPGSYTDGSDPLRFGIYQDPTPGISIRTGIGSDVRFVDTPRIDLLNGRNVFTQLLGGVAANFVDDAGSRISITVEGGAEGLPVGTVRVIPIDGSQGVAIGAISVDLSNGATLRITGTNAGGAGVVSIGHILVTNGDGASSILINGTVQVDVYRIDSPFGLNDLTNATPGGDIVSADIAALNTISISGDLGRTQVPTWGPQLIGEELGLSATLGTNVGDPLGINASIPAQTVTRQFGGGIYRAPQNEVVTTGIASLDDIGSPLDSQLNGLVVRTGSLAQAQIFGAVGDLILQDPAGNLTSLTANSDRTTAFGKFDGIIGNIFAFNIGTIDVGDGLVAPTSDSPISTSGIVAINDIGSITSGRIGGATITGTINAANIAGGDPANPDVVGGIGSITLTGGTIKDAVVGVQRLDGFWTSFNYDDIEEPRGDMGNVLLTDTSLFRSTIRAINLTNLTLTGAHGFFDASYAQFTGNIGIISATGYRNSTLDGNRSELHVNTITGARDVTSITATGDMQDLVLDITGNVLRSISAVNVTRTSINVDNDLKSLAIANDLRASSVVAGAAAITTGRNVQSSTVTVSGPLTITAGDHIGNAQIDVTGPDGRIDNITARTSITGEISASGPILNISVTAGDLAAAITTTTSRGNVGTLSASRDLNITSDISGSVGSLVAGRNIGSPANTAVILVRGDLTSVSAPNGQLYSDLRVGGSLSGAVTLGGAVSKPGNNQVGQGSIVAFKNIASVIINGDFDGDILSYTGGIASIIINNGSLLPGNTIAAYDGSLTSVSINNGDLFGNVHADYDITLLHVGGTADGVFGHIGVNPNFSGSNNYDTRRNQLPPGVATTTGFQGPMISAGKNIVAVTTTGSVFESSFVAGKSINAITIAGSVGNDTVTNGVGSLFAAGDSIDNVTINNGVNNTAFVAGLVSLGSDGRAGGVGTAADSLKSGTIKTVKVVHGISNSTFSAGIDPGADGVYNTADDRSVQGLSSINTLNLSGTVTNVSAFGDSLSGSVGGDARLIRNGGGLPNTNPEIDSGAGTPGTAFSGTRTFNGIHGSNVTIAFSGPGQAFFDAASARLTLRGTTSGSNLTVSSSTGSLADFDVVTGDDASLGTVRFQAAMTGDSDLIVDGNITTLTYGNFSGTGSVSVGGDVTTATFATFTGGFFTARSVPTLHVNGQFGNANSAIFNEARIDLLSAGAITITGPASAAISVARDATSLTINGQVDRSAFRFGNSLTTFTAPNLSRSTLSAGDTIGTVTIGGDMFDSAISAGADLGSDAQPGGAGTAADTLSTGFITTVTIAGNFAQSDITAGYLRGPDGFFGTTDDRVAAGRSSIGTITIGGTQTGSSRGSEAYRIASSGTLGPVMIGGQLFTGSRGNFGLDVPNLQPVSIQVSDIRVDVQSRVSTARIAFNQPMDASSISQSLSVSEVRGTGDVEVRLIEGIDYSLSYDAGTNSALVTFSTDVTSRNLPAVPGKPGPGVYRFQLDQNLIRAKLSGVLLDGNGDGHATPGDNFSGDTIVGDAGDKVTAETDFIGTGNNYRVDLYAPTNLDIVMDNNFHSDGLPDVNNTYTVRGFIGDHPDNDTNFFRFSGDLDVYSITLQAGQILRLGALKGSAILAGVGLFDANGNRVNGGIVANNAVVSLPSAPADPTDLTFPSDYLVKQTGKYFISVGDATDINTPGVVSNPEPPPGGLGDYNFTVQIFDDGDSGFTGTTDAANGNNVVNAPAPIAFAGSDQVFGTADDVSTINLGNFSFTLNQGGDNRPNTADDVVTGSDGSEITSTRDGNGNLTSTISSSIGPAGHIGIPSNFTSDVDIFHLNDHQPIAPGTRITVTVKLTDLGADLGSTTPVSSSENRGAVQFGVFDTSNSNTIDDADLVFSPTSFSPDGSRPNTLLADNGATRYGYDANGDFFITFVAPDRQGVPGASASFAVYLQGVFNTDYQIQVVTDAAGAVQAPRQVQNVLIETNGGAINWLQTGGETTSLNPFNAATLGFTGSIGGITAQQYILQNLVTALNSLFQSPGANGAGLSVHFSTNPSDFEFQPFSTVFLTSSSDPVSPIFDPFAGFNFGLISQQFLNTQPYGASQHSDPLNADLTDEAVVFLPSFALQGLSASQTDVDQFVQSTTAAVARRAGELMGLRISQAYPANAGSFDPFAADSVDVRPGQGRAYSIPNFSRSLSDPFDTVNRTDFFLGHQNARSLLEKVLSQG